jgi:hypothetical protein
VVIRSRYHATAQGPRSLVAFWSGEGFSWRPDLCHGACRAYFDPFVMRRLGKARLQAFLEAHGAANYRGIRGPNASLTTALMAAAPEAIALYESREVVDFVALQREVARELDLFEMHRTCVRQLDAEIGTLAEETGMKHLVERLPGVGDVLGGVLLAYAGERRFRNVLSFKAYCGVIPRVEQSATTRSRSPLTKAGPNQLKKLFLAADIARQIDPQLAKIYHSQMTVKRHHQTQAVCAVATQLAIRLHAILRRQRAYQLRDLEGREISVAEGRTIVQHQFQVPEDIRKARRRVVDDLTEVKGAPAQQKQGNPSSAPSLPDRHTIYPDVKIEGDRTPVRATTAFHSLPCGLSGPWVTERELPPHAGRLRSLVTAVGALARSTRRSFWLRSTNCAATIWAASRA